MLLFANYFLGGLEVLDLQFRNAQKLCRYTVSQKKGPGLEHLGTLSNLNRFSKFLYCWNLLQNACNITRFTLGMLPHHLGKLRIQIFCSHSTDMEENPTSEINSLQQKS